MCDSLNKLEQLCINQEKFRFVKGKHKNIKGPLIKPIMYVQFTSKPYCDFIFLFVHCVRVVRMSVLMANIEYYIPNCIAI